MKYWLRILRAFFGFEAMPKCDDCGKYCTKGWGPDDDDDPSPVPRYLCTDCCFKDPI